MIDMLIEDIYLFKDDLVQYQNSIQGKLIAEELERYQNLIQDKLIMTDLELDKVNTLHAENLKRLLKDYWTARRENKFEYYDESDKIDGIEQDKFISNLYHDLD